MSFFNFTITLLVTRFLENLGGPERHKFPLPESPFDAFFGSMWGGYRKALPKQAKLRKIVPNSNPAKSKQSQPKKQKKRLVGGGGGGGGGTTPN